MDAADRQAPDWRAAPMLRSPIRWVGGKSRLRRQIIPLFPDHDCYVEPFGGAGWVLFGKVPSSVEVFNDLDGELVNFFRVVKTQPEDLIRSFDLELVSRSEYRRMVELDPGALDCVERAHRFYYIIMAGWGGEGAYPRFQTSISDGGHGNRLIGALASLRRRVEPIHRRLSTVLLEQLTWQECLERYDRPGERVFMYIDPPYLDNGANYRHNMRSLAEHEELRDAVARLQCRWMLSSPDCATVRDLYDGFRIAEVHASSGMRTAAPERENGGGGRTQNREILVMNFDAGMEEL